MIEGFHSVAPPLPIYVFARKHFCLPQPLVAYANYVNLTNQSNRPSLAGTERARYEPPKIYSNATAFLFEF